MCLEKSENDTPVKISGSTQNAPLNFVYYMKCPPNFVYYMKCPPQFHVLHEIGGDEGPGSGREHEMQNEGPGL